MTPFRSATSDLVLSALIASASGCVVEKHLGMSNDDTDTGVADTTVTGLTATSGDVTESTTGTSGADEHQLDTSSATFEDDGDSMSSFIENADAGPGRCGPIPPQGTLFLSCCDLWAQDCFESTKCAPRSNDGSGVWNGVTCAPLDPSPDLVGQPCTAVDGPATGIDSCELGALCWNVDPITLQGHCVGLCQGSEDNASCEEPGTTCALFNDGALPVCLPTCDPLANDDCGDGFGCQPSGMAFVCIPTRYGDKIKTGCETMGGCPAAETCVAFPMIEGCGEGCCTPFCDLGDPLAHDACAAVDDGYVCLPWFERGDSPIGYEHVGTCGPA